MSMHHDNRDPEMRRRASGDGLPTWGIAILGILILVGAIMFFKRDPSDTVANNPSTQTSGTATNNRPMTTPPSNPGTGSSAPQGSPNTTGSSSTR
jgi:hypothetical protein